MGGGRGGERGSAVGAAVGWAARGIPTLCNEMGASGRKDLQPHHPPPPEHGTDPPVPLPPRHRDCPAAVCQRRSLLPLPLPAELPGDGGRHRKGCGTRPPDPPKGTPLGCQHQHYTAVWPPDPKRSGGLWLPSQPHVCPHPSPGGVRGVPTQCEVPGGAAQDPAQGLCTAGTAGSVGGTAPRAPPWHRGGDEMAWGPWWQTMGAVVARGPQRHTMRAAMAHRGDHNGRGTTMAHRGHYDGTPWGPQRRIIGTVMAGGPW